jgi:phenylalanine-4-hydroxylase
MQIELGTVPSGYSPIVAGEGGVRVELADHPGFTDASYRARRDQLANLAAGWKQGEPLPCPEYTEAEEEVWRTVSAELELLHDRLACRAFLEGKDALKLPAERIPQLSEVGATLEPLSGFRYLPVAGLAPLREFYGSFADGVFWSTQYLRHPSVPLYTPEPDLIHEVIGHANQLAAPGFAELYRMVGEAVGRCCSEDALRFLSHVFWYTMEFGVVYEDGQLRAYGAGILSSVGETARFTKADIRPFDFVAMGIGSYDITHYQPVLYSFSSPAELFDRLSEFLSGYGDEAFQRLAGAGSAVG